MVLSKPLDSFWPDSGCHRRRSALLACFWTTYSGIVTVPFTLNVPVATGAPVSGWPPPTLTVYAPSASIDLAHIRDHAQVARIQLKVHLCRCARLQVNALKSSQRDARRARHIREISGRVPPLHRLRAMPVFVTVASTAAGFPASTASWEPSARYKRTWCSSTHTRTDRAASP